MQSDVFKGFQTVHCQALPANRALPGYATESKAQSVTATRSLWPQPVSHWLEMPCAKKLIAITSWKQGRKHRHVTQILNHHSFSLWVQDLCREQINARLLKYLAISVTHSLCQCRHLCITNPEQTCNTCAALLSPHRDNIYTSLVLQGDIMKSYAVRIYIVIHFYLIIHPLLKIKHKIWKIV